MASETRRFDLLGKAKGKVTSLSFSRSSSKTWMSLYSLPNHYFSNFEEKYTELSWGIQRCGRLPLTSVSFLLLRTVHILISVSQQRINSSLPVLTPKSKILIHCAQPGDEPPQFHRGRQRVSRTASQRDGKETAKSKLSPLTQGVMSQAQSSFGKPPVGGATARSRAVAFNPLSPKLSILCSKTSPAAPAQPTLAPRWPGGVERGSGGSPRDSGRRQSRRTLV